MGRARSAAAAIAAILVMAFGLAGTVAAEPAVRLNPSSGDPPSVSGTLDGGGWLCTSGVAPAGGASVTGDGGGGSATIAHDGSLGGDFTARGAAGQRVAVKVTANNSCPDGRTPVYMEAVATFVFNTPEPTATPTARPTFTPLPTDTPRPTLTPVPTDTPLPTATTAPTDTPRPTNTAAPTNTPPPTWTPVPTDTPPTRTPVPTETPRPTSTSVATATTRPASVATATVTRQPTSTAVATSRAQPSPTATRPVVGSPTRAPDVTATATPVGPRVVPTASPTATRPAAGAGSDGSLQFVGCRPTPSQVYVEFTPLGRFTEDGTGYTAPTGPAVRVIPAAVPATPGLFSFQPPVAAEEGRVYRVAVVLNDPQCPLDPKSTTQHWLAGTGKNIILPLVRAGETVLEVSNNGDKPPTPKPEVKGAFVELGRPIQYSEVFPTSPFDGWETQLDFWGSANGRMQRFRWSTDIATAASATLQVGMLPFGDGYEKDPLSPPGLLASWPVDCVDCEFVVDLSPLPLPAPKGSTPSAAVQEKSWLDNLGEMLSGASQTVGDFFGNFGKALAGIFGGANGGESQPAQKAAPEITIPSAKVTLVSSSPGDNSALGSLNLIGVSTFYFRVVPLADGKPAGGGSNTVLMKWGGYETPPNIDIKLNPPTPTPTPSPSAYEVKIISYHGVIKPLPCPDGFGGGYVVAQDVWWDKSKPGVVFTTEPVGGSAPWYKKGQLIGCPKEAEEPSVLEKIGSWVSGAWNWASEAYSDLKNMAISAVGFFLPDALCSDKCVGILLDAALVSMGIPPDIPNLDQLMSEGLDYVAQQAVAQVGVPPEVYQQVGPYAGMAVSAAEAKFKAEAQAKLKEGLEQGIKSMQSGHPGVPLSVPVRPNQYQPPAMSLEVTRKQGVAGGEAGCTANVYATLTIDKAKLDNPPPGWKNALEEITKIRKLVPGQQYDFFANVSPNSAMDRQLPVPVQAPGSSVVIPMSFQPNAYYSGWDPWGSVPSTDYYTAWHLMHVLGDVHFSVYGCGSTSLDVPADSTYAAP